MRLTDPIRQIVSNQTLEALKKSISKTIAEAAPHIQAAKENQIQILGLKFSQFNDWYMRTTGLDKVYLAQEKVTALQDQLLDIQEKRRGVGKQLSDIRQKSMELQDEIHKVKRQEDLEKFLDLMKKETEVLKLERSISKTFQDYDQTERELFTGFSDSIRDSHEKQRAQMEYTKYFGIILSLVGSFLAFLYSTLRKKQLKQIIDERLATLNQSDGTIFVSQLLDSNQKLMQEILSNRMDLSNFSSVVVEKLAKLEGSSNSSITPIEAPSIFSMEHDKSDFFGENTRYVKVFGAILGLWLIAKVLSG